MARHLTRVRRVFFYGLFAVFGSIELEALYKSVMLIAALEILRSEDARRA